MACDVYTQGMMPLPMPVKQTLKTNRLKAKGVSSERMLERGDVIKIDFFLYK